MPYRCASSKKIKNVRSVLTQKLQKETKFQNRHHADTFESKMEVRANFHKRFRMMTRKSNIRFDCKKMKILIKIQILGKQVKSK
jgi:hypothetical protein